MADDYLPEDLDDIDINRGVAYIACPVLGCDEDIEMNLEVETSYEPNDSGGHTFGLSMNPDLTYIGAHLAAHARPITRVE